MIYYLKTPKIGFRTTAALLKKKIRVNMLERSPSRQRRRRKKINNLIIQ